MPEKTGNKSGKFELGKTGWKKLDRILQNIVDLIAAITPVPGLGIEIDYSKGAQINQSTKSIDSNADSTNSNGGGGTSGTPIDVTGAFNAAAATYHFLQSSPPTPIP